MLPTSTPLGGVENTATAETQIATAATTAEPPTVSATEPALTLATSVVLSPAGTTQNPGIPVTGVDIVLVECQFCIDGVAHALLILPDTATFKITSLAGSTTSTSAESSTPACTTVEVNNGQQVVLCSGPEMTPITLNICTADNACTDFPVDLLACPIAPAAVPTNETPLVPGTESASPTPTP
jgi:hypothetical protein